MADLSGVQMKSLDTTKLLFPITFKSQLPYIWEMKIVEACSLYKVKLEACSVNNDVVHQALTSNGCVDGGNNFNWTFEE